MFKNKITIVVAFLLFLPLVSIAQNKTVFKSVDFEDNPAHLTKQELVQNIGQFIKEEANENQGYFTVFDSIKNVNLDLSMIKVHGDCLKYMGDSVYFDCGYFNDTNGKRYDIDIFMKWNGEKLVPTQKIVHKVNYIPRYDWLEKDGLMKAVPVGEKSMAEAKAERQKNLGY